MAQHFHQQHRPARQRPHGADHHHGGGGGDHDDAGLADMLELDSEVLGSYLDEITEWVGQLAADSPGKVVDVGAGTGSGSLALARRFGAAEVVSIDQSLVMLDRLRSAALRQGLGDRVRVVQADMDVAWPRIGEFDIAWAASSLHHIADPDRLIADIYAALNPGGLLVVVELDALPRFLPDDIGFGRPGLEVRCHDAMAKANWNAHPDWRPHLERAGFEVAGQRSFVSGMSPAPPDAGRYAHAFLTRVRHAFDGQLAADDLSTLDHLLADDHPGAVLRRGDLAIFSSRTAWAARRLDGDTKEGTARSPNTTVQPQLSILE